MRVASPIVLSETDRRRLREALHSSKTTRGLMRRLKIVEAAGRGAQNKDIAARLGTSEECVARWRRRFLSVGLDGLLVDAPRSGRRRVISDVKRAEVAVQTLQEKPAGRTHWSRTSMAEASGLSRSTVGRIWKDRGIKPHILRTFKLSKDKQFEPKLRDVVGLYLAPPRNAVVFSCDEKCQIQALDRTQPGLPIKKGQAGTWTHDYKRNGTTTLVAALNVLTGAVIGTCQPKHTQKEWLAFLKYLYRRVPADQDMHVIADNYSAHKAPTVKTWLASHPRVHMHFTPTSSSWLNLVERWFGELTENAVRRGVFTSVQDLVDAIDVYIIENNRKPTPFIWKKTAEDILAKVLRARTALETEVKRLEEARGLQGG
jgi:transposase